MVFGFGFNKAKVLASAEKNVKQGKLHNAVADYEKILNEDPKDLTVMNTVGDLYARIGNTAKAIEYFRKVGDVYARDGFTVKAIAMYKKLTKQDPSALEINIKLAELYTQQGLFNDARSHYMQVADFNLRNGDMQATARIFQKMLELDPENVSLQGRLAELYAKLGKTAEARDLYFRNAEAFRTRGSLDLADDALANVLKLDPKFSQAIQLRAAVKLQSGDPEAATELLEKMPDLDSRSDALRTLLEALLQIGRVADADPVARKLLRVFDDASGIISYADALMSSGSCEPALQLYREHADRLLVADMTGLMESLQASIAKVKSSPAALEILADLFQRAGKTMYVVEVTEVLAHALVQEGQLSKACELYKKLVDLEPENPQHSQSYQQVKARLGHRQPSGQAPLDDAPQTFAIEEIQCGTQLQQDYPVELQEAIDAAFTDAELFDSYNLAPKAILPLEAVLPRVPNDVRINFRLASLYARSGRLKDAAERCRVLEGVYREAGYTADANQFSDLMRR
ncbi:MAG TPA: tetratricopeptide repeat protein, partial [Terriglobales bacterium]|nr:tetratricopeptide repeat protein [Terriglobales bacterium]